MISDQRSFSEGAMATATRTSGKPTAPSTTATANTAVPGAQRPPIGDRLADWAKGHRKLVSWVVSILAIAAALFLWTLSTRRKAEDIAGRNLAAARFAFDNQNLPLAASDLSKLIEDYSGTNAAEEGRLLLANLRLIQGQPQQAVAALKDYAGGAGRAYKSQAFNLLGGAYENMGRPREAADAYERGSAAAQLDFFRSQLLDDAGRAWTTAGDTAKAIADYQRVAKDFPKETAANEAKVRLAELTKGALPKGAN
jgi:tetratricopeptide (TPR) repeat protein